MLCSCCWVMDSSPAGCHAGMAHTMGTATCFHSGTAGSVLWCRQVKRGSERWQVLMHAVQLLLLGDGHPACRAFQNEQWFLLLSGTS